MGLVDSELNELRKLLANFKDGRVSRDDLFAQVAIYNQTDKRLKSALKYGALLLQAGLKSQARAMLKGDLLVETDNILNIQPIYDRTIDRGH